MGFSNNSDYFGDWYGKGQIDFNAIINPDDEGDVWMVKMWSGSGYALDVYLCKAHDYAEAMDIVFNWSYDNEGANKIVFDYDYLINECQENFEKYPDYFGTDLSDDYEEFEMRWFEDYVSSENYDLFARSENFFVDKVPDEYLVNSRKPIKSENDNSPLDYGEFADSFGIYGTKRQRFGDYVQDFTGVKDILNKGLSRKAWEKFHEMFISEYPEYLSNSRKPVKSDWERTDMASGPIWDNGKYRIIEKSRDGTHDDITNYYLLRDKENLSKDDVHFYTLEDAMESAEHMMSLEQSCNIASARRGEVDTIAADELALCTENDGDLYRQMTTPIIKNLKGKIAKGTYDEQLALKAWLNLVTAEARKYVREFGSPGDTIDRMFNLATREEAAKEVAKYYEEHLYE